MKNNKIAVKTIISVVLLALLVLSFVFMTQLNALFEQWASSTTNDFARILAVTVLPGIVNSIRYIAIFYILLHVLQLVCAKSLNGSKRSRTIVKMANSFIKWIMVIILILMILSAFGVNTSTLLASAGILTLVIGLGAQSLVADIVAGVFIVLEGEYEVDDIVVIDGWRGTVEEIGMRTTKIVDAGGNIKIINNSEIKTVINQTKELSLATCTMSIEYGESLPRVEKILEENLEQITKGIAGIVEGIYYKGVSALGASSVDLLFIAKCKEEDIYQVQRDMNRSLKLLFDEHKINIPFPQIVINQPSEPSEN